MQNCVQMEERNVVTTKPQVALVVISAGIILKMALLE